MAKLILKTGKKAGSGVRMGKKPVIIGRGDTAQLQITDTKASREHCKVFRAGDTWVVADLNSSNGIVVNGSKTTRQNLKDGDRIAIGETVIVFETEEARRKAPDTDEVLAGSAKKTGGGTPAAASPTGKKGSSAKERAFAAARADAASGRSSSRGAAKKAAAAPAKDDDALKVSDHVLQYSKVSATSNLLTFDVDQMSTPVKILLVFCGMAFIGACLWGVVKYVG